MTYTRKFVILKKELGTITGRNSKGHSKLEMKGLRGVITVNIENVEVDNFYNVVFVFSDKSNPTWDLGKLFTDDLGRGRGEYTFMQKDFGRGNPKGILITKDGEVLLGGYIDKEDGTIENYIKSIIKTPRIEEVNEIVPRITEEFVEQAVEERFKEVFEEPIEEPVQEPIGEYVEEYVKEVIEEVEEVIEEYVEEVIEDILEEFTEEFVLESEYKTEMEQEVVGEEIIVVIPEETVDKTEFGEPDHKTIDYIKKLNQKNQTTNYVLSILRFFPYIDPFKHNLKGYNWWLVELDKENEYRAFLPYFSYLAGGNNKEPYSNYTTCNQLMNKYQHYLFGLYNEGEEVKYFVYGVPGSFTTEEHPNKGTNGFNTWYPGENMEGYWIIYIDPMTGKPAEFINPMVPIN